MSEDAGKPDADKDPQCVLFSPAQWTAIRAYLGLTPRQTQICKYVCQGQADKNISAVLGITLDTVRMHLREIFRKLDVQSRVKLVVKLVITNRELQGLGDRSPGRKRGGVKFGQRTLRTR